MIRIGIVGCGAIVESGHLPACQQVRQAQVVALADTDVPQAQRLAREHGVPQVEADYRALQGQVNAVIVATPPHLHLEQAGYFLDHGIPVLCEKPLACDDDECHQLLARAAVAGVPLAVGLVRRFFYYAEQFKSLLDQGQLGAPDQIYADEGYPYGWPARTDHAFRRDLSPGGVMFDLGIHALDLFTWLLGPIAHLQYGDDAIGGIESNAELTIEFASGARGRLRLSRTCERPNRLVVRGRLGWAQASIYVPDRLTVQLPGQRRPGQRRPPRPQSLVAALATQLDDFLEAVAQGRAPRTTGQDALATIQLVQECYRQRKTRAVPKTAPIPGMVQWT